MDKNIGLAKLRSVFPETTGLAIDDWREETGWAVDVVFMAGGRQFAVEYKASSTSEAVGMAIRQIAASSRAGVIPLVVAPYMGEAAQQLCRAASVSWLDLSGNADIDAPPIRIRILGEANRYKRSGRPESLFASRSARLARILLLHPDRIWPHADLVRATGISGGFLSRLLPRYLESAYLKREVRGRSYEYTLIQPARLLDAWRSEYDFARHTIIRGHIAARNGPEQLHGMARNLEASGVWYAATGLASAWLYQPHAAFRTVTVYIATIPEPEVLAKLGFHQETRGSNTWLVVPDDDGVFTESGEQSGVRCVSALQTYLDLKGQPERADEAAVELRRAELAMLNEQAEQVA